MIRRGLALFQAALLAAFALSAFAGGQASGEHAGIATPSSVATNAGLQVLRRGGTAADAAVAVAFTLAVVQPQSGNLGGGGFLVYYDAATRGIWTLDFRETAPRGATREALASIPQEARPGALLAGVPGTVAGLGALHGKFGSMPWRNLVLPAAALARDGFLVDSRLGDHLAAAARERESALLPGAETGNVHSLPDLASTLQRIAAAGAREFYTGETARKLVEGGKKFGSNIGYRDLREYEPIWRSPVKLSYREYDIYTVSPPAGGGLVIGSALAIVAGDNLRAMAFQAPAAIHLMAEAERRAYIDRDRVTGDPSFARIPYRDILSKERAEQWRQTIDPKRATSTASLASPAAPAAEGTFATHFTIADSGGNVVSFATTLGAPFGSGVMIPGTGFFINAALGDFGSGANALDPLKRPASPLAPAIVLREGKPFLALGSGGGRAIPATVLQVILNLVVWNRTLADAIAAPRYHHLAVPDELVYEQPRAPKDLLEALNAVGHGVSGRPSIGEVYALQFEKGRIIAVADERGSGAAGGF